MPFVYILRCRDDSLYVGHTENLDARIAYHNAGHAAAHTASRLPVTLVYFEELPSLSDAIKRERQLKGWSGVKKAALIRGDVEALNRLSKRRQR